MQEKATKVKVTADYRANGYLTVGKHYNIQNDDGSYFWLEPDDVGGRIFCLWENCAHGYEYEPFYEDTRKPYWDYMLKDGEGDQVNHPSHYNESGVECIDAIRASLGPDGFQAYCKGNCMKYLWRYQYKNGLEDLKKAQVYLKWMVESVEELGE